MSSVVVKINKIIIIIIGEESKKVVSRREVERECKKKKCVV